VAATERSATAATITETFKNIVFFGGPIDEPESEEEVVEHPVGHICFKLSYANPML
jgi:hypothetical protein